MNDNDNDEIALALTALTKPAEPLEGDRPTVEALSAFIDGTLNDDQIAHIKRFLAHDSETYNRWISLITSEQALMDTATDSNDVTESKGFSLTAWLSLPWLKPLAGGMAVAGLFMLMINPAPQTLDDLYMNYPPVIPSTDQSFESLPTRSMGVVKPILEQALEYGVQKRAQQLLSSQEFKESGFANLQSERPTATESITDPMIDMTIEAGEFALLQQYHCDSASSVTREEFLNDSQAYTEQLIEQLSESGVLSELNIEPQQMAVSTCALSKQLLDF